MDEEVTGRAGRGVATVVLMGTLEMMHNSFGQITEHLCVPNPKLGPGAEMGPVHGPHTQHSHWECSEENAEIPGVIPLLATPICENSDSLLREIRGSFTSWRLRW